MKLTKFIPGLTLITLASLANADVTIDITGATAFRSAAVAAIRAKMAAGGNYKFGHSGTTAGSVSGSGRATFIGTFPGISGTTTIRCHWTGSVEGIRSLVNVFDPTAPTFILATDTNLAAAGTSAGGTEVFNISSGYVADPAEFAFSDVTKASTPYSAFNLLPSDPAAGVVVFTMVANEGAPFTNVTSQQYRALLANGFQPRSLFSGIESETVDNGKLVFAMGRNDLSGTRTTYLAETGFGISKPVKQYVVITGSGNVNDAIQLVPAGGVNADVDTVAPGIQYPGDLGTWAATHTVTQSTGYASTVWGQNVGGNGGYSSGGTIGTDFTRTSSAVTVFDDLGADAFGSTVDASFVSFLGISDAVTARAGNGVICGFNGVRLDGLAGGAAAMTAGDISKVAEGLYTAWGYENLYRRNDLTGGDAKKIYDDLKTQLQTGLGGNAGLPLSALHVGRTTDGGTVGF